MKLEKAKGKKPGKDQHVKDCPYCGQAILVNASESKKKPVDPFGLILLGIAVLIVLMLALMVQQGSPAL